MKNQKLWGGRFRSESLAEVDRFNASVAFDHRLYFYDIIGSIAHARMLAKQSIIQKSDASRIVAGLKKILRQIEAGKFRWELSKEDVHLNIESKLIELIGPVGGKLHTARSRNDQVATDLRLYCRDQVGAVVQALLRVQRALLDQAKRNIDTLLPGYTHLQRAQPVSLAHYLLAYFEMLDRDLHRLGDSLSRINTLPLGAGALAGTTFPIDRNFVARALGFESTARNSLDAVSDRDFVIETLSNLSLMMMHLSRLAEEWILWSTQEFQFLRLPEAYCTGSSMMPQKINPDVLELIRGKTGRVYGALQTLLTLMKGLPLAYNKDMQEDKEPLFDAFDTVLACLNLLAPMIAKTRFKRDIMEQALDAGFVLATDLADYLAAKGLPFRQAHRVAGEIVAYCQEKGFELKQLSLAELRRFDKRFAKDVATWLDPHRAVDRRGSSGGTARKNVRRELARAERNLTDLEKYLKHSKKHASLSV
ncbi:MAG TPA: argininosuccinate lyase [Deltaproteobacteria bacterium]|nr:argininosuccinate lyase [Deltaproteobacteria bacterium]